MTVDDEFSEDTPPVALFEALGGTREQIWVDTFEVDDLEDPDGGDATE